MTVGSRLLILLFLVIEIASIHLGLGLRIGGQEVFPYFGSFLAGVMLIILCRGTIKLTSVLWLGSFFCLACTVTLASYGLAGVLPGGLGERARSLAALAAAMTAGYGMFLGIRGLGRRKAAQLFLYLWLFIVVFAFLEVYGGMRPISDAVRAGLRPDRWLYELDLRDLGRYGAIRPKVFAAEPSIVGYTASLCLTGWFVLGLRERPWWRLMLFVPMMALTWYFVRSPAMAAGLGAALLAFPYHVFGRRRVLTFRWWRGIFHPILAALVLVGVVLTSVASVEMSARMAGEYSFFSTGSFFIRQVGPFLTELEILRQHPLLGIGVGGDDLLYPIIEQVYVGEGVFIRFPELFDMPAEVLVTNGFYSYWHALGLVGGAAGALLLFYFCMTVRALPWFVMAATAVGVHAIGGMNNPRTWTLFFLYTAVSSMVAPRFATVVLQPAPAYRPPPERQADPEEAPVLAAYAER